VALMQELARRVGADNPNQFARWFDEQADASTQESGKWRHNFNGNRPLSSQQLNWLSKRPEFNDVHASYLAGPSDLWLAVWGDPKDLWSLCRTRFCTQGPSLDDCIWPAMAPEDWGNDERGYGEAMREFEGELLLAEAYAEPLELRHLTEAIALYRLHHFVSSIAPTKIDGSGAYRCVRMCTENFALASQLDALGVYELLVSELVEHEAAQLDASRRYRASIPVTDFQLDAYLAQPQAAIPEFWRWEALQFDWAP
jgi:hypothetical protein